ncbi:unnamed protein product [Effrenium voratum]|uniref:N-alpha-acetyltransferase 35, NatC auxiliary subunit n=1 Tax=Effrenium voratum TaxID=2562239 RepID=A0AA36JLV7_9DINO|nr:unnamed protein product [Effrenium voratum]CAJ1416895.1 unnamed protein product [Effrenium voratum]
MPEDEEEEEELEDGKGDTKKKKPRKKKKKKKSQEDEEPDEAPLNYWPAPEGLDLDRPPGQNEEWVDITSLCDLAVSGMNLGEMVESPSFRLYDAMSAIEIMDPKMDTGYKSHEDMTLERAEKLGLVSAPSPEVLTGVMDHLLMYYLLWLDGHTIIQTCFSCLYLQDLPRLLAIPALGSFVDAFLIACQSARDAITCAGVYDDEDFMPTMFGVDLQACVFSSDWQKANEKLKSEQDRLVAEGCEAAALRLNFMGKYMSALVSLMARVPNVASAKAHLAKCSQLLPRLAASATEPSDAVKQRFDASSQRKLLVPGPPRTVEPIEDPKVVFRMWTSHVNELVECCSAQTRHLNDLLQGVIKQKEKPNVLSRSMAQLVFDQSFVRRSLQEILELFLFPPEALQHCRKQAEPFLQRCESMFLHLLKLAHLNVARRFRRLAHVFPDFNELQHEAWRLDEALKSTFGANLLYNRPSWVFIMEYALQAMISKLLLGFQLELYEEAEFHMIYWYVDYLFGLRIYNLNEVYYAKENTGKKKSGARPKDAGVSGKGNRPRNPPAHLLFLEATQSTVRGLFRLLAFCLCQNLLPAPKSGANLCQRFVLRFRSLEMFRLPHLPSFQDFEQSAALAQDPAERKQVLTAAQSSFAEAAQLLEKAHALKEDLGEQPKSLKRVVVANQLGITQLLRCTENGMQELSGKKVTAETSHHTDFVSIQVVDKPKEGK